MRKVFFVVFIAVCVFSIALFLSDSGTPKQQSSSLKNSVLDPSRTHSSQSNNPEIRTEQQAKEAGAQAEIDRVATDALAQVEEMDKLLQASQQEELPDELAADLPDEKELEALIAQVEQQTGQKIEVPSMQIDPVAHPKNHELQQNFEELEKEMQELIKGL